MAESPPRSDAGIEIIPLPAPTDSSVTSELWTIRPGDHLWRVAEQTLMQVWHRRPTTAEITPYWRAVVELNRSRLAVPDNPDLVFPGQRFILPPPPLDPSPASTTIPDRPADR